MTDERFEFELRSVLREIAGSEAPASLRRRLADVTARPASRWLWFSPPLRFATAAVVLAAVLALAFLLMPRENIGPLPSTSPTPGASVQSLEPTPSVAPTSEPTPEPTPVLSSWTGIEWTDPFAPFPYQPPVYVDQKGTSTKLHALVPWNGAFVGVGSISHGFACEEAAFFHSDDGVTWAVTDRFSSGDQFNSTMCPDYLLRTSEGLLAIGQRRIWSSTDGVGWTEIDSPSWRALWTSDLPQLMGVASGPSGVVAIGLDSGQTTGTGGSVVVHSVDGSAWEQVDLPADLLPNVRDVGAYPSGFVIVGRDGQPDGAASPAHPAIVPGLGSAAAWTSSDGVIWTEASVQADRVQGGGMTQLLIGSGGLFALGLNTGADYYPLGLQGSGEVVTGWTSVDGTSWDVAGALAEELPPMAMLASDGTTMVGLGLRQPTVGQDPTAWASADGVHWTALTVSGPVPDVSYLVLEPQLLDNPPDSALWVLPDGLVALGAGDGVPVNFSGQWFRFGSAVLP